MKVQNETDMPKGKMLMVAVTGRSGSGKSSVSAHYAAKGYPVADGDVISREVTRLGHPCLDELREAFGEGILHADGSLDRSALAKLAFASKEGNQKLVDITHPHIIRRFMQLADEAKAAGSPLFFIDGAVIIGGPVQPYCDKIIVVVSENRLSVSRIILRDGISKTAAYQRLAAQLPEAQLVAAADYVIDNNGSLPALQKQADEVLQALLAQQGQGVPPGAKF